jgi:hypothetical protein
VDEITTYPDGSRVIHRYEQMTAEKRPKDPHGAFDSKRSRLPP